MKPTNQKIKMANAEEYITDIFQDIDPTGLSSTYKIDDWTDVNDFLEKVALKTGKLLKKGEPDTGNAARMLVNDLQKGKLSVVKVKLPCNQPKITKTVVSLDCKEQVADEAKTKKEEKLLTKPTKNEKTESIENKSQSSESTSAERKLSLKERRAKEKSERAKKSRSNFYDYANVKNKRNRPTNIKNKSLNRAADESE